MKKKKLLVQKTVLMAVCMTCVLSMSACGFNKKNNQNNQNNQNILNNQNNKDNNYNINNITADRAEWYKELIKHYGKKEK